MQSARNKRFYRNALLYTAANLIASVLNYLYYPIVARMVGVSEFGELQIVTSLLLQLATVFNGLNLISISLVSNSEDRSGRQLITALQKVIVWLFFGIFIFVIAVSPLLGNFFHFTSPLPFALMAPSLLISAISIFWTAYLQAKEDFASLSLYAVVTAASKIVGSAALIVAGFHINGAIFGISIGLLIGLFVLLKSARYTLPPLKKTLTPPSHSDLVVVRRHVWFIGSVVMALVLLSVLLSVDSMIVKRMFDPVFAGHYAGISTIARIIFFASAPLVGIMLPLVKLEDKQKSNQAFWQTLRLSLVVSLAGLLTFSMFPHQITQLLLGSAFTEVSGFLPILSLLAVLSTILNVQVNYALALRDSIGLVLVIIALVLSICLTIQFHGTIYEIVASLCAAVALPQVIFWIYYCLKRQSKGYSTSW